MTRAEKVAEAQRLRGKGLLLREIAAEMGCHLKSVSGWLSDPDGSKLAERHRRFTERHGGTCEDCGEPTSAKSISDPPRWCEGCAGAHLAFWDKGLIVEAIQAFAEKYGRRPSATDWNPQHAELLGHGWRADRFYKDGTYPVVRTVLYHFGTWNAAMEAAGFAPRTAGSYPRNGGARIAAHLEDERPAAA